MSMAAYGPVKTIQFIAKITKRKDWPLNFPQITPSPPNDITQRTKPLTHRLGGD